MFYNTGSANVKGFTFNRPLKQIYFHFKCAGHVHTIAAKVSRFSDLDKGLVYGNTWSRVDVTVWHQLRFDCVVS